MLLLEFLVVLILYATFHLVFFENFNSGIFDVDMLSKINIAYIFLFTIGVSVLRYLINYIIELDIKFKHLLCIILIIVCCGGVIAFYNIYPKHHETKVWYGGNYTTNDKNQLMDFIFLPKNSYFFKDIAPDKLAKMDGCFLVIIVLISMLTKHKKTGKIAYIGEELLKTYFRYGFIIIFFMNLSIVSPKYLFARNVFYCGAGGMLLYIIIKTLRIYLDLANCSDKNKNSYGKENLIVVMTTYNYKFSIKKDFLNPLIRFRKFDTKNISKGLLVDGKEYSFISYTAERCKLIDVNQYKNVAYLIVVNDYNRLFDWNEKEFFEKIVELDQNNKKFLFYHKNLLYTNSYTTKMMKQRYSFRYRNKLNTKDIFDFVGLTKDADKLKERVQSLLYYINDLELVNYMNKNYKDISKNEYARKLEEIADIIFSDPDSKSQIKTWDKLMSEITFEKNRYIKYGLNVIINSYNYVEYCYTLLKICEYVTHYMALKNIIDNPENMKVEHVKSGTLSAWRECIAFDKEYSATSKDLIYKLVSEQDVYESLTKIRELLNCKQTKSTNFKFKKDICQVVADIRNKLMTHGVITNEVAEKLAEPLFNITCLIVIEFEALNISIKDDEKIKNIFEEEIYATYKNKNEIFLYSDTIVASNNDSTSGSKENAGQNVKEYKECLNYETGKRKVINDKITMCVENIDSAESIEKALGRWVTK